MVDYAIPITDNDTVYDGHLNTQMGNMIETVEAGENLSAGNVVYIHLTDSKAYVSDTGTADDIRATGIALTTATSGNNTTVLRKGVWVTTGLTAQQDYYLGAAGAVSTTLSGVRIGHAVSTTQLYVDIVQDDRDMLGTIKAWHKTMTALPSNVKTAFWAECDGSTISDAESPLNGEDLPDMNTTQSFIRGAATSGGTGGDDTTQVHTTNDDPGTMSSAGTYNILSQIGTKTFESGNTTQQVTNIPVYVQMVWIMKVK